MYGRRYDGTTFEQRYQSALPQLAPGGIFEGFQAANSGDLTAFSLSAGVVPLGDFATNSGPITDLIDLVGVSYISPVHPEDMATFGLLGELTKPSNIRLTGELFLFPTSGINGSAALIIAPGAGDTLPRAENTGIWLYRAVPEPIALIVAMTMITPAWLLRRARRVSSGARKLCEPARRGRQTRKPNCLRFELLEPRRVLSTMADIVFLDDESQSNGSDATQDWLRASLVPRLEASGFVNNLASKGITDVRYGLIGFAGTGTTSSQQSSDFANSFVVDNAGGDKLFGNNSHENAAMLALRQNGTYEDGWDAIEHAIAEYNFRPGAVPVLVLVQSDQGRRDLNQTLTREGILAAMQSKNVILDSLVVGADQGGNDIPLFDLSHYEVTPGDFANRRILGVEADAADGVMDGQHDYYLADKTSGSLITTKPATQSAGLEVSHAGSNTGLTGMVGSGRSIEIAKNLSGGLGPNAAGYRATSVPFQFEDIVGHGGAVISPNSRGNGQAGGIFSFVVTLLTGDLNVNNVVAFNSDVHVALNHVGLNPGASTWSDGDFNGNGSVSFNGDVQPALNLVGLDLRSVYLVADLNNDFIVNSADIAILAQNEGMPSGASRAQGDLDGDGDVDTVDLAIMTRQLSVQFVVVS